MPTHLPSLRPTPTLRRCSNGAALAFVATVFALFAGCSAPDDNKGTFVLIDDRGRGEANLTFGGVKLTSTAEDIIKLCASHGWKHNLKPAEKDQRGSIVPSDHKEVRKFDLVLEDGFLIQLTVEFHKADPTRHTISGHYAKKRRMPDGAWAMSDSRRQTVVIVNRDATRLHAVHVARLRDRDEAKKLLGHFVEDDEAQRAAPAKDPAAADAPKP